MERRTIAVYDERGEQWARARRPVRRQDARAFGARVQAGAPRLDAGCGAGRYTADLGAPTVGLDASLAMLGLARAAAPAALLVQGDLEALPFRHRSLAGAWANMSYLHVPRPRLPLALAELHWCLHAGAPYDIQVLAGDFDWATLPDDDVPGREFAGWAPDHLADVLAGAGLSVERVEHEKDVVRAAGVRLRSLPDTVAPGMRLLVCGLNPSVYAADRGLGFARPGNRFWRAAVAAGVVSRPYDPLHALRAHGVGMTDLVKRATVQAAELRRDEYALGARRVERLVQWLRPAAVCFVGLDGWRASRDRRAVAGWQSEPFGGAPAYVMPSTSGLNARTPLDALAAHLRAAAAGP